MEDILKKSQLTDKVLLRGVDFPKDDVLPEFEERKERSLKIHKATSLGNLEQKRVHVVYSDGAILKRLYTTIWAQTTDKIIMRDGITLPVHRIVDVVFETEITS